jgi:hypothetical protein
MDDPPCVGWSTAARAGNDIRRQDSSRETVRRAVVVGGQDVAEVRASGRTEVNGRGWIGVWGADGLVEYCLPRHQRGMATRGLELTTQAAVWELFECGDGGGSSGEVSSGSACL